MGAMVLGFIPFGITMGDAIYPQREVKVMDTKGQIATIQKNSWTKHLSLSHNERYNFVLRMTASVLIYPAHRNENHLIKWKEGREWSAKSNSCIYKGDKPKHRKGERL